MITARHSLAAVLQQKQMRSGALEFEVWNLDLARGIVVAETIFSGEPIEQDAHVGLAVALLDSVRPIEMRGEER